MALAAQTCWEVRTTGSDSNGGGCRGNGVTPAPSAPSVSTATSGGSVAAGTYYVKVVLATPVGEGPSSAVTSITTTGSASTITVTAPALTGGATSYSVYLGTSAAGPFYQQATGQTANYTRTTTPASSGTQPIGIDYSQQDAAQVTVDGATITATVHSTTSQLTITGHTVAAADVGNILLVDGGTATAGRYEIQGVDIANNRWILDRSAGTAAQTATGAMGGALLSPAVAAGAKVAGNDVWIRSGTYAITTTSSNVAGGIVLDNTGSASTTNRSRYEGYQTTRGDLGTAPVLSADVGVTSVTLFQSTSAGIAVVNVEIEGNSRSGLTGLSYTGGVLASVTLDRVKARNCPTLGIGMNPTAGNISPIYAYGCLATGCGIGISAQRNAHLYFCEAYANSGVGISCGTNATSAAYCLSYANGSDGLGGAGAVTYIACVAYGNGGVGIVAPLQALNCIAEGNTGVGYSGLTNQSRLQYCAGYNNAGGNYSTSIVLPANVVGFVAYSASAFTDAAAGDFSLNSTAGGGAALRTAGVPGTMPRGTTTGHLDIGVAQHEETPQAPGASISLTTTLSGTREETFATDATVTLGGSGVKASSAVSGATLTVQVKRQSDDVAVATLMSGSVDLTTSYKSWATLAAEIGGGAAATWAATPAGSYYVAVTVTSASLVVSPVAAEQQFVVASASDTTAPSPAPDADVTAITSTGFTVTVSAVSGEAGTTLKLQTRAIYSPDAWTDRATDASPAIGDTLSATGLTTAVSLEWRIVEVDAAGNVADGSHGYVTPASAYMASIKAAVKALMGTVSGLDADTIHARIRDFGGLDDAEFQERFATGGVINGWEIEQESGESAWIALDKAWEHRDSLMLRGYYSHSDEGNSEATFRALVHRVVQAINGDHHLQGTVLTHGLCQLRRYAATMLGGRLVHYAEIGLPIRWCERV